ncbi:MAG: non-canonical purine NTP pyrophosphatase, partial [Candidatus Adiutrix sp.]|nr:non-canonical purine NTP pyrophosphatase [Candidatus Adiutrix sp.]
MAELFILIATKNRHKAEELAALIIPANSAAGAVSLADWEAGSRLSLPAPEENARAFVENALSKARSYAAAASLPALADDSGLSVAALGGAPGVFSARYG